VRLERHEDRFSGGNGVQAVSAGYLDREGCAVRLQDPQAPLSHGCQVRPASNQGDLEASSGKASTQIAAGGTGPHDGKLHS
jgi:hypothetical protein